MRIAHEARGSPDSEEDLDVREITIEGKKYLIDDNNNLYSTKIGKDGRGTQIGIYTPYEKKKIIFA